MTSQLRIEISGGTVEGEGEAKIVRALSSRITQCNNHINNNNDNNAMLSSACDENDKHIVIAADSDVMVMLTLVSMRQYQNTNTNANNNAPQRNQFNVSHDLYMLCDGLARRLRYKTKFVCFNPSRFLKYLFQEQVDHLKPFNQSYDINRNVNDNDNHNDYNNERMKRMNFEKASKKKEKKKKVKGIWNLDSQILDMDWNVAYDFLVITILSNGCDYFNGLPYMSFDSQSLRYV